MSEVDLIREIEQLKRQVENLNRVEYAPIACRVYNDAAFTHNSSGNWLAITFNSEYWDTGGMHSTSTNTNRITCALGGWYLVGGHVSFAANATGKRGIAVRQDGTSILGIHMQVNSGASDAVEINISTLIYVSATSFIELTTFQDSGGNLDILRGASWTPEFWAIRLP